MFGRFLSKGLKNISINSKKSHIFLKDTNFSLVIMRPYDLVQLGDLVGSGSEDILIWTGKTIGKSLCANIQEKGKVKSNKKLFDALMTNLTSLGYGKCKINYVEGKTAKIEILNSILQEIKEDNEAQLIRNLYSGIFIGAFNSVGLKAEEGTISKFVKNAPLKFNYEFIESEGI